MEKIAISPFQTLFKCSNPSHADVDHVLNSWGKQVTDVTNQSLIKLITLEEIRVAVVNIHHSKTSRPEGIPFFCNFFFQKFWSIVLRYI